MRLKNLLLLSMVSSLQFAHARVCEAVNDTPRYNLYLIAFQDGTVTPTLQMVLPGKPVPDLNFKPDCTVVTALDADGHAVYQTSLPFVPKVGHVHPVCIPVDRDIAVLFFETYDGNFKARRLGNVQARDGPFIYRDRQFSETNSLIDINK